MSIEAIAKVLDKCPTPSETSAPPLLTDPPHGARTSIKTTLTKAGWAKASSHCSYMGQ